MTQVLGVSPRSGALAGGTDVRRTGEAFQDGALCRFGDAPASPDPASPTGAAAAVPGRMLKRIPKAKRWTIRGKLDMGIPTV